MAPTDPNRAVEEKTAALTSARSKREEILRLLVAAHEAVDAEGASVGKVIADGLDAAPGKARLAAALAEVAAYEAGLEVVTDRVRSALEAARGAERAAGLAEIQALKVEAEQCRKETLAAAEVLAKSHARWHSIARRCERVAMAIGRPSQPIAYDGLGGQLCTAADDGTGIPGALRKHGITPTFGAVRERLPVIEAKTKFAALEEDDEDEFDDDAAIIVAENVSEGPDDYAQ